MQVRYLIFLAAIVSSFNLSLAVNEWHKKEGKKMFSMTDVEKNEDFKRMNFEDFDKTRGEGYQAIEILENQKYRPTKDFEFWAKIVVYLTTVTLKVIMPFYFMEITANAAAKLSHSNKNDPFWNYFVLSGALGTLVYAYAIANTDLGSMLQKTVPVPLTEQEIKANEEIDKKVTETKEKYTATLNQMSETLLNNQALANQLTESNKAIKQILATLSTKVPN
ncbi:hypothetical protein IPH25_04065 [bacterium]|nr:MAG: hypothetical protein IPG37_01060 [bacterium]QQR61622.1 MAG: hypothetical protein IPH25_04065 [bacterium]QQR62818.1 MAG: hypothetical protein IPH67_05420 [bacterium]